jgi:hypothetical protein
MALRELSPYISYANSYRYIMTHGSSQQDLDNTRKLIPHDSSSIYEHFLGSVRSNRNFCRLMQIVSCLYDEPHLKLGIKALFN